MAKVEQFESRLDMFSITDAGSHLLELTQNVSDPILLSVFRVHRSAGKSDIQGMVAFECMLELGSRGWGCVHRKGSRKLFPFSQVSEKVWFYNTKVDVQYLRVLLSSQELFQLGLREIHHFQGTQYYKTFLFMRRHPHRLNDVLPHQTHAFYKLLRERAAAPAVLQMEADGGEVRIRKLETYSHTLKPQTRFC